VSDENKRLTPLQKKIFIILSICVLAGFILVGIMAAIVYTYSKDLPDVGKIAHFEPSESSHIFAADGTLIGVLYKENRTWVNINDIPQKMQEAIIATEDSRFYRHSGIDPRGIMRALFENVRGGGLSQGASTITQQLARNIFLGQQRSMKRKIQEILLSLQIERKCSKKQILEYYLNQIYFGSNAYGIQAAADTYFGKKAKDLTLPECAVLAGLPAAPSEYSPLVNRKAALERQKLVLQRMAVCGFITPEEEKKAAETILSFTPKKSEIQMLKHPYFTAYALHELLQRYSEELLYRGGLKIYTTLDLSWQKAATSAIADGLREAKTQHMNATNAALVAINPENGFIKAMVGGREFTQSNQFNRAWQARRPPGSSFKVFVYSMALEQGYTPDSLVDDSPVTFATTGGPDWSPKNSDGRYMGTLSFRDSLKWSRNICAAKVLNSVGIKPVAELAKKMGINDSLVYNLPLALGSSEVTVLDMAAAYSVLAAGGKRCNATSIRYVRDSKGKIIEDNRKPKKEEVLAETAAYAMTEILEEVVRSGTGTAAQIGRPAAGKTGTTDEHRDAWFCGYVPQASCAIWTGNDDNTVMNRVFGGTFAASIWARFMRKVLAREKIRQFSADEKGRIGVMICSSTGLRATGKCTDIRKAFYTPGSVPQRFCAVHGIGTLQPPRRVVPTPKPTVVKATPGDDPSPGIEKSTPHNGKTAHPGGKKSATPEKSGDNSPETVNSNAPTLDAPGIEDTDAPPSTHSSPIEIETPGTGEPPVDTTKTPGSVEL